MNGPVLIIGGGGLLGIHLAESLSGSVEVVSLLRTDDARAERIRSSGARVVVGDCTTLDLVGLPAKVGAVVHLAQSERFRTFPVGAGEVMAVNGPAVAAEYALRAEASAFVYASSGSVYAPSIEAHDEDEALPTGRVGFYAASKISGELVTRSFSDLLRTAVVRPFFMYGKEQQPAMLLRSITRSVQEGRPIQLRGASSGLEFNPIHASDAALAVASILTGSCPTDLVLNLAGDELTSLEAIANIVGAQVGREPIFERFDGPKQAVVGSTNRRLAQSGPTRVSLEAGIAELCAQ